MLCEGQDILDNVFLEYDQDGFTRRGEGGTAGGPGLPPLISEAVKGS